MPMINHTLKCVPGSFKAIKARTKPFTVRRDDRNYIEGDLLLLREYDVEGDYYTGEELLARVSCVHQGLGMQTGFVVLGLAGLAP